MVTVSSPELIQFASSLSREPFGPAPARALADAYDEFTAPRRRLLAPIAWWTDGRDHRTFFDALTDRKVDGLSGELRLGGPVSGGAGWEFLVPFRRLVLRDDGSAELHPGDGGVARRGIVRFLLRDRFPLDGGAPAAGGTRASAAIDTFGTLAETIAVCRATPVLPLGIALLLYLPAERVRFEIDLVRSYVLADPRAGRLSAARRVTRTARFSWSLDRLVGRGRLSPLGGRCLELLAETHGLTAVETGHILDAPKELVEAALRSAVDRGFVTLDRRTARYHARVEAFLPKPTAAPTSSAPAADPALRTGVQELLAAAEAKATCPLCGGPIGPEARDRLLCDACSRAVGIV